jgi:DNA end-binding protein Ku
MQHALWHGAISFGLIYVPVDLYGAAKDGSLALHYLDSRDFSPVGYRRINKSTGQEVDWKHIVHGYEYEKGRYVALSDADLKRANVKASETIQIANFTDAVEIPAMYFDTPYYLSPAKGGRKVYALLREALKATGKAAVATFVMRGRQHLCVIVPEKEALMLLTLRFASDVLPPIQVKEGAASDKGSRVSPAEIAMAKTLVEQMSGPFRPGAFKDTYRNDLMRRIREKVRSKETHTLAEEPAPQERPKAKVIDLMEALRSSLKRKGSGATRSAPRRSTKQRKRA